MYDDEQISQDSTSRSGQHQLCSSNLSSNIREDTLCDSHRRRQSIHFVQTRGCKLLRSEMDRNRWAMFPILVVVSCHVGTAALPIPTVSWSCANPVAGTPTVRCSLTCEGDISNAGPVKYQWIGNFSHTNETSMDNNTLVNIDLVNAGLAVAAVDDI